MKITLNSKPEEIVGYTQLSVKELLKVKNFTFKFLAVRINNKPILPSEFETAIISDGDTVVVLHLISGG